MDLMDISNRSMKSFAIIILLGLSLLTALMLETNMTTAFGAELVIILIGIILTAGVLFGLWMEAPWAYPLSTLLFAAALANMLWVFALTKVFLIFAFGLLVNVAGLVMCLVSVGEEIAMKQLETYSIRHFQKKTARRTVKRKKKRRR